MAAAHDFMDKAELKKLLVRSKKEPVSCAVGIGANQQALIMLHKIKQPHAIAKELEKEAGELKNPRWGNAFVDVDADPKLVILTLNKPSPGLARRLKKTLKGTGFVKVEIRLEDGTVDDAVAEEDGDEAEGLAATPAEAAAPAPAAVEPAAVEPAAPVAASPDMAALVGHLTELVRHMLPVIAADPTRQEPLAALATQAQAAIKSADQSAAAAVARFEAALAAGPAASAPAPVASMTTFAKARTIWVATRHKVQGDIDRLQAEMAAVYQGHGFGADLDRLVSAKVEPMLDSLDETLAEKLDEIAGNADPTQHARLVQDAHEIIDRYESYVAGEPLIAKLDTNPFVPLQIRKTLNLTLTTLAKAIG